MAEIRIEKVVIPTYSVGEPETNPLFLERRINQGATGCVYPYYYIDVIGDDKSDKEYEAVFLENEYIKIMVLPELGGRIQMAYDKIKNRHFVYYNTVIKPALIGLLGPWISGGVEFNWPLHHRPTTYQRLDYKTIDNKDGSKTLWLGEQEKLFHTRCSVAYTIYPNKAYLKISPNLYNGTDLPQRFLWWANIAVRSDKQHQHVFPPDVKSVHFHAKSDSGRYPVMRTKFCGMDFSQGVNVSYNENIPASTSYMATPSKYPFSGAYSHEEQAGVLHAADAGISPGKKLFSWGNSKCAFARGWMKNLTDSDGPYLELMAGVFTDNQPDFAWLSPGEEKRFDEYIMPYNSLGVVKNANQKGVLQCENQDGTLKLGLYVTSPVKNCKITVSAGDSTIYSETISVTPEKIWIKEIDCPDTDYYIQVTDARGNIVIDWQPENESQEPLPHVLTQVKLPEDIRDNDELFLTGLHTEQYLHATYKPEDYYLEALKRDRTDSRCNMAMGRLMLRRGDFKTALKYLEISWKKFTMLNFNPYDGEISFLLGLCNEYLGDYENAYKHYYKSVWNGPWQSMGYFALSRLECRKKNYVKAEEFIKKSIAVNALNRKARHLAAVLNRKLGNEKQALASIERWLQEDPIDIWMLYEKYLLKQDKETLENIFEITRKDDHPFINLAIDYAKIGLTDEAYDLLSLLEDANDPMVYYHQAYYLKERDNSQSAKFLKKAEDMPLTPFFPNRLEDIAALQFAIETTDDYKANYLLGNLLYDKRQYQKAMKHWRKSVEKNKSFGGAWRNLAVGTFNKLNDHETARQYMEKAVKLEPENARFIAELNELYINSGASPQERLKFLEKHKKLITKRDDLKLDHVTAVNLCRRYEDAVELMEAYTFHPWECKEGLIGEQYVIAKIALGSAALSDGDGEKALNFFEQAMLFPDNFGEEKLCSATDNDLKYFSGLACELKGERQKAEQYYRDAIDCDMRIYPALSLAAVSKPDYIFYRGLALKKLGDNVNAAKCFNQLIEYGIENQDKEVRFHYLEIGTVTTVIFDEDINRKNKVYCAYLQALGELGLKQYEKAQKHLHTVLNLNPNHSRASLIQTMLDTSGLPFS